jgi:hypothetical protein
MIGSPCLRAQMWSMTSTLPPNFESGYPVRRHQVEADHAAAFIDDPRCPRSLEIVPPGEHRACRERSEGG